MKLTKKRVLSIALIVIMIAILSFSSLAWFTDNSNEINNIFHVAEFDLEVSHRLTDGKWESIESIKNNADGTLTCVFEDFCPVLVAVKG